MLVVRPNKRRMQQFRDSPAENALAPTRTSRFSARPGRERMFLAAGIACAVILGLFVLSEYVAF